MNSRIQSIAKREAMLREHGINSYIPTEEEEESDAKEEGSESEPSRIVSIGGL